MICAIWLGCPVSSVPLCKHKRYKNLCKILIVQDLLSLCMCVWATQAQTLPLQCRQGDFLAECLSINTVYMHIHSQNWPSLFLMTHSLWVKPRRCLEVSWRGCCTALEKKKKKCLSLMVLWWKVLNGNLDWRSYGYFIVIRSNDTCKKATSAASA